jgi:hypothetical protein
VSASGKIDQYAQIPSASIVPAVSVLVLNPNDTTTAPASSGGSNQRATVGQLFPGVVWPSSDVSGVKDTAAVTAAVSALPSTGGVVLLMPGTWYITCGSIVINRSNVWISAAGCLINALGAGDCFRMYDSSNMFARVMWGGGILGSPVIDGTSTTGNSCAFHGGDITGLAVYCQPQNFRAGTTSKGVWLDSQWWWTEQAYGRVTAQNNRVNVQFDNSTGTSVSANATGSYDRLLMDVVINSNGYGDGVVWAGGAFAIDYKLGIWGNFGWSAAAVYSVLKLTGSGPGGASYLDLGELSIGVEVDGSGTFQPQSINFSASPFTYINRSWGQLDFFFGSFAASNNSGGHFQFAGTVNGDTTLPCVQNLGNPASTGTLTGNGQTLFTQWYGFVRVNPGASVTGTILQAGGFDSQAVTIRNLSAANSITFAVAGTSNMARGTGEVIAALTEATYHWDGTAALWYRTV